MTLILGIVIGAALALGSVFVARRLRRGGCRHNWRVVGGEPFGHDRMADYLLCRRCLERGFRWKVWFYRRPDLLDYEWLEMLTDDPLPRPWGEERKRQRPRRSAGGAA